MKAAVEQTLRKREQFHELWMRIVRNHTKSLTMSLILVKKSSICQRLLLQLLRINLRDYGCSSVRI